MTDYELTAKRIKMGFILRDDMEETARTSENKLEIELALFMAELTQQYAQSWVMMTEKNEDYLWWIINAQADCLVKNLDRTIVRLKMRLSEYVPDNPEKSDRDE